VTNLSAFQVTVDKQEAIPYAHAQEVCSRGRHGVANGDIQPIASNKIEQGRYMNRRIKIDLYAGF